MKTCSLFFMVDHQCQYSYTASQVEDLFTIFHGRPSMPIEVDRMTYFLARNEQLLLAECERTGVITGARYVCLQSFPFLDVLWSFAIPPPFCFVATLFTLQQGFGLFAAKDFKKGDRIGSYFGAIFLSNKGVFLTLYKLLHFLAINNMYPLLLRCVTFILWFSWKSHRI